MKRLRTLCQVAFTLATVYAGVRLAFFNEGGGVERFCPFAGAETAWSLITEGRLSCSAGALNVSLLLALIISAIVVRKAFCSWICPFGAVSEWLYTAGKSIRARLVKLERFILSGDKWLRWLRVGLLAVVLVLSWISAEMVFRSFDPYYVLFSVGGHDVKWWSFLVLLGVLLLAIIVPLAWCRYLCPLGALLWPFARPGVFRVVRDEEICTSCRACDRSCKPGLLISENREVSSGDCSMCLDCLAACPTNSALKLKAQRLGAVSRYVVPATLMAAAVLGVVGASIMAFPSAARDYQSKRSGETKTSVLTVKGIRCSRTASQALEQLEDLPGIIKAHAFGPDGRMEVTYDASVTDITAIIEALEGPYLDKRTNVFVYNRFKVTEVDGEPYSQSSHFDGGTSP